MDNVIVHALIASHIALNKYTDISSLHRQMPHNLSQREYSYHNSSIARWHSVHVQRSVTSLSKIHFKVGRDTRDLIHNSEEGAQP